MGRDRTRDRKSLGLSSERKKESSRFGKEKKSSKVPTSPLTCQKSKAEKSRDRSREKSKKHTKSTKDSKKKRKHKKLKIRFMRDDKLITTKYFRKNDIPTSEPLSESQIYEMKDRLLHEASFGGKMISQPNSQKAQQTIQERKDEKRLTQMAENIKWSRPKRASRGKKDNQKFGNKSEEKDLHAMRISSKIACFYSREYQIPDRPNMSFTGLSLGGENHNLIKMKIYPFEKISEHKADAKHDENLGDKLIGLDKELRERNRKQLLRRPGRAVIRTLRKDSDSESYTSESDDDIEEDEAMVSVAKVMGALGITLKSPHKYLTKLRNLIKEENEENKAKISNGSACFKKFEDSINKVDSTLANIPSLTGSKATSGNKQRLTSDAKKRMNPKYKTVPCRMYHSPIGCTMGDDCDFIHDPEHKGRPTPNMNRYVRPISQLSRRPESNMLNLMKFHQHNGPGPAPGPPHMHIPPRMPPQPPNINMLSRPMGMMGGYPQQPPPMHGQHPSMHAPAPQMHYSEQQRMGYMNQPPPMHMQRIDPNSARNGYMQPKPPGMGFAGQQPPPMYQHGQPGMVSPRGNSGRMPPPPPPNFNPQGGINDMLRYDTNQRAYAQQNGARSSSGNMHQGHH